MPKYQAPAGYQLDSQSGLYYKESQMTAPNGQPVRHIYWFNAETGEYAQQNYLLSQKPGAAPKKTKKAKPQGKKRRRGLIALASLFGAVVLLLGAGFVVRKINAPEVVTLTPEQIEEAAGIADPDPATNPVFEVYKGMVRSPLAQEDTP